MRAALISLAGLLLLPEEAFAYRPFDSTDPAVAEPGIFEIEAGPLSYRHDEAGRTWIAPELRLNYGFAQDWEIVLEGQGEFPQRDTGRLVENMFSLKNVIKEGSLQDKEGLSIAAEYSVLLPGLHDENGLGAEVTGVVGQKFNWGAVHVNLAGAITRDQHAELFFGTILEGPSRWTVRPVAEFVYERAGGRHEQTAFLLGAIWVVKDGLAFDAAVRQASVDARAATEVRAGLTFDLSLH